MISNNVNELIERMDGSSYADYCRILIAVYWNM